MVVVSHHSNKILCFLCFFPPESGCLIPSPIIMIVSSSSSSSSLFVTAGGAHMPQGTHEGQFSPSTLMWVPGIEPWFLGRMAGIFTPESLPALFLLSQFLISP